LRIYPPRNIYNTDAPPKKEEKLTINRVGRDVGILFLELRELRRRSEAE
jgi:hypothetical protein